MRWILIVALVACAPAALHGQSDATSAAPSLPAGLATDTARPYHQLVRAALDTHHPHVLSRGVEGATAFVWFQSDGAGRITRTALDSVPPRAELLNAIFRERWPDVDADSITASVVEPLYPNAVNSWHRPGEFGPDSLVVFWLEQPVAWDRRAAVTGPYLVGRAVAQQVTPHEVRIAASRAIDGEVVWFLYDDERPLIETGMFRGVDALEGIRAMLAPRHPEGVLTCSMGSAVPNLRGEPVRVFSVRIEPRPTTP